MKIWIKKSLFSLAALLLVAVTAAVGLFARVHYLESRLHPVTMPFSEMVKMPMCIDRVFSLDDTEKCFGFADYVFIGTVEEILGTEYDDISMHSFVLYEEMPETHFSVKCLKNIKGTAPEEFTLKTCGGQQPNGTLEEFHPMPENKSTCLFMCTENDGKIYYFNCICLGGYDWYSAGENVDEIIEKYEQAYKNEDLSVRRFR